MATGKPTTRVPVEVALCLSSAEGFFDDHLEVSSRVQAVGKARGRQSEGAREKGDVKCYAALHGPLHHAGKQVDRVDQRAAVDVVIDGNHGAWPASAVLRVAVCSTGVTVAQRDGE